MHWTRREITRALAALWPAGMSLPAIARAADPAPGAGGGRSTQENGPMRDDVTLTSVDGLLVGHRTRAERPTGCTAIVAPEGATAGVAVRGAAPGTRELALLDPTATVEQIHAVMLSGGSAFGLATADGAARYLRETGIGFEIPGGPVPIVPAAILFDLGMGEGDATPTAEDGYAAARIASADPVEQGCVGAGAGATFGKLGFGSAMKGGIGSAGYRFADGTVVAALVALNALGDVRDPSTGGQIGGAHDGRGNLIDSEAALLASGTAEGPGAGQNTTIGVVATNRTLSKVQCHRLAGIAHDGLARAVVPAHTRLDGDTLFMLATNRGDEVSGSEQTRIDAAVAASVSDAIVAAVHAATSVAGYTAARDL